MTSPSSALPKLLQIGLVLALGSLGPAATQAQQAARVEWQPEWSKLHPIEYAATLALGIGTLAITLLADPRESGARGGVLFDSGVRDLLRLRTRSGRDAARTVGDLGFRTMLYFPLLDAALTWAIHGNAEVAWQMFAMDAEALAFAGFIGVLTDHVIGRARPSTAECKKNPEYERFCNEPDENASFISGHSVIAAAGAGVTCAHHLSLPLYGGGAGDIVACAAAATLALTTGLARIANDRHWATDVTVAFVLGGLAGYAWPKWFHYRLRQSDSRADVRMTVLPMIAPGHVSGNVLGAF